jgi:ABC-type multidrug transport system permease subunit
LGSGCEARPVSELPRWWIFMLVAIIVCVIASGIITVVKL